MTFQLQTNICELEGKNKVKVKNKSSDLLKKCYFISLSSPGPKSTITGVLKNDLVISKL